MLSVSDLADGAAALNGAPDQDPLALIDLDTLGKATEAAIHQAVRRSYDPHVVLVGVSPTPLPHDSLRLLEALTCTLAPTGPGRAWVATDPAALERLASSVRSAPHAALTLANLLPTVACSSVESALVLESLAYSTLLGGAAHLEWRARTPIRKVPDVTDAVLLRRDTNVLTVTLNRPERRNAFGRALRDAVIDALTIAELDGTIATVHLGGNGPSFCAGGDLDEFGTASDPAAAHITRLGRSAGLVVHRLRERVRPVLHGACIGAGIEIPCFADRVVARDGSWFRLPELAMGLIPGAGGTVSLTRRIGRHRTAYMALTGDRVDLGTALSWGLVDARV